MKKEKSIILASLVLIAFSIVHNTHAFWGLLPRSSVKPNKLKESFLYLPYCIPHAFEDKIFELGLMEQPHHVLCSYPSTNNETYLNWLKDWKRIKEISGKIKASSTLFSC